MKQSFFALQMKKLILPIGIFVFFTLSFLGGVYAKEEPGSKITCDQVWKIIGSEGCERFVVSNGESGVWCNLPDTRESLQPWIYGPAPTYTFTPGTCSVESADQPAENPKTPESEVKDGIQKEQPKAGLPLFAKGWLDYFRNLWVIVSYRGQDPIIGFVNGIGGMDHTLCDPATCEKSMEAVQRETGLSEDEVILRSQSTRASQNYKIHKQNGDVTTSEFNNSSGLNIKTGQDGKVFSTFKSSEDDIGGIEVFPNTQINLPLQPFQNPKQKPGSTAEQSPTKVELEFGEVEIIIIGSVEKPTTRPTFTVATPNAQVTVSGTHFWVSYDKDKNTSTVGVYDGQVEVKTKDGKKTTVSPAGIVMVTSKFSLIKAFLFSLVLAVVLGGVVFFLRKKFS